MELLRQGKIRPDDTGLRRLPPYVGWKAIARELGVSITQLPEIDPYWLMVGEVLVEAEHRYQKTITARQGT